MKKFSTVFTLTFLLASEAFAFDMPVEVISGGGDNYVGKKLVYFIKEGIRKSSSMHITYDNEPRIQIRIITIEVNESYPGYSTAYNIVWLISYPDTSWPLYITSTVGHCGDNRVQSCADSHVAETYQYAERLFKFIINN